MLALLQVNQRQGKVEKVKNKSKSRKTSVFDAFSDGRGGRMVRGKMDTPAHFSAKILLPRIICSECHSGTKTFSAVLAALVNMIES